MQTSLVIYKISYKKVKLYRMVFFSVLHSLLRWVVLALFVISITNHLVSYFFNKKFSNVDKVVDLVLLSCLDIMLLLGLLLFISSPSGIMAYKNLKSSMSFAAINKIVLEHPIIMILAIALAHIGLAQRKKDIEDKIKHKRILIFFLVSLCLILIGIPKWG